MSTVRNNNIFAKTSFLGANSSEFIEQLYVDYLEKPDSIQKSGENFF